MNSPLSFSRNSILERESGFFMVGGFCLFRTYAKIAKDDEPPSCQERQDSILYLPNKIISQICNTKRISLLK
jgi:hypothetical protein